MLSEHTLDRLSPDWFCDWRQSYGKYLVVVGSDSIIILEQVKLVLLYQVSGCGIRTREVLGFAFIRI